MSINTNHDNEQLKMVAVGRHGLTTTGFLAIYAAETLYQQRILLNVVNQ